MLTVQPFFIGGIENVERCKGSAFGAAGSFFFCFLLCIIYLIQDSTRDASRVARGGPLTAEARSRGRTWFDDNGHEYGQVSITDSPVGVQLTLTTTPTAVYHDVIDEAERSVASNSDSDDEYGGTVTRSGTHTALSRRQPANKKTDNDDPLGIFA